MFKNRLFVGFIILVVAGLFGGLIYLAVQDDNAHRDRCKKMGGHVATHTTTAVGVGVGSNGKPVTTTTTTTTSYCLSSTGGILDIW